MCRYDSDDYDWMVESTDTAAVDDRPVPCEDCGRRITAGEVHVRYTAVEVDEHRYVFAAQRPEHAGHAPAEQFGVRSLPDRWWIRESGPWWQIDEDDEALWTALGFVVAEAELPAKVDYHEQCAHCHAANLWLVKVCDQHTVLVTAEDLDQHRYEYAPRQLGRAFVALHNLCRRRWRYRDGLLADPAHVQWLTTAAVKHALSPAGIAHLH